MSRLKKLLVTIHVRTPCLFTDLFYLQRDSSTNLFIMSDSKKVAMSSLEQLKSSGTLVVADTGDFEVQSGQ